MDGINALIESQSRVALGRLTILISIPFISHMTDIQPISGPAAIHAMKEGFSFRLDSLRHCRFRDGAGAPTTPLSTSPQTRLETREWYRPVWAGAGDSLRKMQV